MKLIRGRCYAIVLFASAAALAYIIYYSFVKISGGDSAQWSAYRKVIELQLGKGGHLAHDESKLHAQDVKGVSRLLTNLSEVELFAAVESDELIDSSHLHQAHLHRDVNDEAELYQLPLPSPKSNADSENGISSKLVVAGTDTEAAKTSLPEQVRQVSKSETKQKKKRKKKRNRQDNNTDLGRPEVVANVSRPVSEHNRNSSATSFNASDTGTKLIAAGTGSAKTPSDLVNERRRLAETKRRLLQEKIWFDQDINDILKTVREGGVVEVYKKPDTGQPEPVNARYWDGLDAVDVYKRYPGVVLLTDYVFSRPFIDVNDSKAAGMQGSPQLLDDMTEGQAEERFYQLLSMVHIECRVMVRMGSVNDGGWDLCNVAPYSFSPNTGCLVYSFGINYDFTFDDAMALAYNCTVKSFDPSMTVFDHVRSVNVHFYQLGLGAVNTVDGKNGWKLMSLKTIKSKLGHTKRHIDVLKIDIDYNEWACLREMMSDGSLTNVKQLIFEIHTSEVENIQRPSSKQDFYDMYTTLVGLERVGFRRYNYHYNIFGRYTSYRTAKTRTCCYELYYVNIRYLHSNS